MSTEESEWTIADLRNKVRDLEERIEYLEGRAGKHDCLIDVCDFDRERGECRLRPVSEVWDEWDE